MKLPIHLLAQLESHWPIHNAKRTFCAMTKPSGKVRDENPILQWEVTYAESVCGLGEHNQKEAKDKRTLKFA